MRILILGKNGMLGHDLQKVFHKEDFIALDRTELDITQENDVFEKFMTIQPEIVINATGYTKVDLAEQEEELANKINGYGVGILARACREIDATFVHFSTDYVFNGKNKKGYTEETKIEPINAYGRSKALGELLLTEEMELENDDLKGTEGKYFIIRTSWLFGNHGKNFVEAIINKALKGEPFKVIDDQHGCPTFTMDLCQQVKWLVESHEYPSGIYHITNSENTTWFKFAQEILKHKGLDHLISPCTTEDYPLPAPRPKNSILLNTKLPTLRSWKESLAEYMDIRER